MCEDRIHLPLSAPGETVDLGLLPVSARPYWHGLTRLQV